MAEESIQASGKTHPAKGLIRSKVLWLAILITAAGAAWWAYSAAYSRANAPSPGAASSLVDSPSAPREGQGAVAAPAAFRYGSSFVVAFLIGFLLKKIIRSVLLIAALLIGAIMTLKYFGILNYDWASAQSHVEQGVGIARQEGEKYRAVIMGYLPSGLAAGAGAIFGARRG
ncbi:MAG: hypothetical protein KF805_02340 [Phycisphaeraceae bacterium]|nr:hypothetical protein [Phycisphaeraceae bacterium]